MPTLEQVCSHAVTCGGEVRVRYDQGLDSRARVGGHLTAEGWCAGMAVLWVKKKSLGEDFWAWFGASKPAAPDALTTNASLTPVNALRGLMALQYKVKVTFAAVLQDRVKLEYWAPSIEETTALRRDRARDTQIGKTTDVSIGPRLGDMIANAPGFRVIIMGNQAGEGHALAAEIRPDGSILYMDPNFGEYEFPSKDSFRAFITKFFDKKPYKPYTILRSFALS